jgi:hypothetical protein
MTSVSQTSFGCACLVFLVLCLAPAARGQRSARLRLDDLNRLAPKAEESIEVNIDENLLRLAPRMFSKGDAEEARIRELISGLKGVYVKVFNFNAAGAYTEADIDPIRAQLKAPGWSRLVGVRSREKENVEVYVMAESGRIDGLAIISSEPNELVVVNLVGTIDIDKLSALEGQFGIPRLGIERKKEQKKQR